MGTFLGRSFRGFGTGHSPCIEPNLMKNMLSCLFLFFKQTDCTNWTQFPRTGRIRTRFQWQTNWHRTKLLSGLWHPLCSLCVSQRTPRSFTQPQITPQMPSYSALNNKPLIRLWSSQLAYGLFGKANFRSVGRLNVRGRGTNSSTGVQSLWARGAKAEAHSLGLQNTPVSGWQVKQKLRDSFPVRTLYTP